MFPREGGGPVPGESRARWIGPPGPLHAQGNKWRRTLAHQGLTFQNKYGTNTTSGLLLAKGGSAEQLLRFEAWRRGQHPHPPGGRPSRATGAKSSGIKTELCVRRRNAGTRGPSGKRGRDGGQRRFVPADWHEGAASMRRRTRQEALSRPTPRLPSRSGRAVPTVRTSHVRGSRAEPPPQRGSGPNGVSKQKAWTLSIEVKDYKVVQPRMPVARTRRSLVFPLARRRRLRAPFFRAPARLRRRARRTNPISNAPPTPNRAGAAPRPPEPARPATGRAARRRCRAGPNRSGSRHRRSPCLYGSRRR